MKLCILLAAVLVAACGGGSSPASDAGSIGPAGGTATFPDGTSVLVPSGALAAAQTLTETPAPNAAVPSATTAVGGAVTFGPEGQQFARPVTVTLPFTPGELPQGSSAASIVIYTAPAGSSSYTALTTTQVDSTHVSAPAPALLDLRARSPHQHVVQHQRRLRDRRLRLGDVQIAVRLRRFIAELRSPPRVACS